VLAGAVFDWSNTQNGKLIGSIGIISAVVQGGYVRRALTRVGELKMARRGTSSCALGLVALALVPHFALSRPGLAFRLLQGAAVCLAITSATVVNALTALASLQCDEAPEGAAQSDSGNPLRVIQRPELAKGQALGRFRSSGQLGRAIGPLLGKRAYFLLCRAEFFFWGGSVYILLDLWAICDIYNWRYRHDRSLCIYAKSCASSGFEDGLTEGISALVFYHNQGCYARPG
jgi:hypothetical protein